MTEKTKAKQTGKQQEILQEVPLVQEDWAHPTDGSSFDDPLLDCLVLITKFHGRAQSHAAFRAGLPLENNHLTPELFVRAAARAGMNARIVQKKLGDISQLVLPAVLLLKDKQAMILHKVDHKAGVATVLNPDSGGEKVVKLSELRKFYNGYAIFLQLEHRYDERAPELLNIRSRNWFWGTIIKSWRIYRDVLIASILINLFALASPMFIMNVYDRVVPNNAVDTLWVMAIGVTVVYSFDLLMRVLRGYFVDVAGKKADIILSSSIFEQVMGMRMENRSPSVGAFANNLKEFDSIRDFITSATIITLVDLPFVLLFLFVIFFIGGPVVYVAIAAMLLVLLYGIIVQSPLRKAVEANFRASGQKGAALIESLTAVETIKTLGAEGLMQQRWEQLTGHIAHWSVKSRLLSASATSFATFVQQMSQVGVVVAGVYLIVAGDMSMGALIACVILTGRALAPMGQVAGLAVRYYQSKTALSALHTVMSQPVERPRDKNFVSRERFEGAIEFADVSFAYPEEQKAALSKVSFKIEAGEHVAIIGKVGSGKTTVEKLVQGLYMPTEGGVSFDGTDIRQIDPVDLRRNIGYVPQDVMLFYGSVKENIVLGSPYVDDADILKVAEVAGVKQFVDRHPHGFDMQVGEAGSRLSGGQRQSIAIARALLLDPPFLMMDEPSNSMDNSTEDALKRKLINYTKDKTFLLVTHRASLLDLVDRIIVMDNGKVIADGPKDNVLEALKQGKIRGGEQ